MTRKKLNQTLSPKQLKILKAAVAEELSKQDLKAWQEACKSLAPFDYDLTTRKAWFEKNKDRVATGKKIIRFYDGMAKKLRKMDEMDSAAMKAIRDGLMQTIREIQDEQGYSSNKLNDFKIATLRTLVAWAENPSKLEVGPYEGSVELPKEKRKPSRAKRGRKSAKGKFDPPQVELVKSYEIKGNTLKLDIGVSNNNLHPFQNVDLELILDPKLEVKSVKEFTWKPSEKKIHIGFIPSSLDVEPLETIVTVDLKQVGSAKTYSVDGVIHFDNTEKGVRERLELERAKIKL